MTEEDIKRRKEKRLADARQSYHARVVRIQNEQLLHCHKTDAKLSDAKVWFINRVAEIDIEAFAAGVEGTRQGDHEQDNGRKE